MSEVYVIGGANIDIIGKCNQALIPYDSNIGHVTQSFGGVGRNIAENIARLGFSTHFISALGNDAGGKNCIQYCESCGMDMSHCLVVDGESTSTYLAVLDHLGDMSVAINDMGILNRLTQEHLQQVLDQIQEDDILMIDTNLDVSLIEWMMKETKGRIFVDPISCGKATKLKGLLSYIDVFKPNVFEAEYLTGIPYENEASVDQMGQFFLDQGIKEVFISLGSKGVRAYSKDKTVSIQCEAIEVVNATGAGDAFMGAITAATLMEYSLIDKLKFAQASAICTLMSHDSVCRELSVELVNEQMKKYTFNIEEE